MSKINTHPFTDEGIVARMSECKGQQFQRHQLAKQFKVSIPDMRAALDALALRGMIKRVAHGSNAFYLVPADPAPMDGVALSRQPVRAFKEMSGYESNLRKAMIRREIEPL